MMDVIAIGIILLVAVIGCFAGFGNVLKFLSDGILGIILTVVVCYFLFGTVLALPFVQSLLEKLVTAVQGVNSPFLSFLFVTIRLDLVIYAVVLYLVVALLRKLVVFLIGSVSSIETKPMIILNRIGGTILALLWLFMIVLIIFQVIAWVVGTEGAVYDFFNQSFFLGKLYQNNPLNSIQLVFNFGKN